MTGDATSETCMEQLNGSEDESGPRRGKPTMKEVAACFHLPIEVAAKQLGVGQTWLKLLCRSNGVSRWPFRKIQSLQSNVDRSKKMQNMVEVAKVINKNLPKWLDMEGQNSDLKIPKEGAKERADADISEPVSRPVQTLHDTLKPVASLHSWQLPAKREQEYDLRIKVLGGGLDRSESSIASPKAQRCGPLSSSSDSDGSTGQKQWQRVLQGALAKQNETPALHQVSSGFGSKTGGAFKPVPQSKPAVPQARMPAPLDLGAFFRVPFCPDQLPSAFASSFGSQRPFAAYGMTSTQGLEQLLAATTASAQPISGDHRGDPRSRT